MKQAIDLKFPKIIGVMIALAVFSGVVSPRCYAQQGRAQTVRMDAYAFTLNPGAAYNVIAARRFIDRDNATYVLDPSGQSYLNNLELRAAGAMRPGDMAMMGKITGTATNYYINLNNPYPGGTPMISIYSLQTTDRITWDDFNLSPPLGIDMYGNMTALGGKHVYDVAEGIYAPGCAAGDVVVISDKEDLTVVKSRKRFDPRVAGIISGNPKLYMGIEGGKTPMALLGVVKCKVSAENGAIKPGDLLVTASVAGHAMAAAADQVLPGMLVGKALETWEKGTGEILVLVNKQ